MSKLTNQTLNLLSKYQFCELNHVEVPPLIFGGPWKKSAAKPLISDFQIFDMFVKFAAER